MKLFSKKKPLTIKYRTKINGLLGDYLLTTQLKEQKDREQLLKYLQYLINRRFIKVVPTRDGEGIQFIIKGVRTRLTAIGVDTIDQIVKIACLLNNFESTDLLDKVVLTDKQKAVLVLNEIVNNPQLKKNINQNADEIVFRAKLFLPINSRVLRLFDQQQRDAIKALIRLARVPTGVRGRGEHAAGVEVPKRRNIDEEIYYIEHRPTMEDLISKNKEENLIERARLSFRVTKLDLEEAERILLGIADTKSETSSKKRQGSDYSDAVPYNPTPTPSPDGDPSSPPTSPRPRHRSSR